MVRLKKAVPPTETGITRRAVVDLQAQIEKLTAAVAALSTQHATTIFHYDRNNQAANDDEFEEDENPLSRLRHQPSISNNNNKNGSDLDNKLESRDGNNFFVQDGDPIFDFYDTEEEGENFSEQIFAPIFDVSDHDDTEKFSTLDVADEDVSDISPIYDVIEEDEMNQVGEKVEDVIVNFNESIYAQETSTVYHKDFAASIGVKNNCVLKDITHTLQTMSETSDWNNYYFEIKSLSTKEDCFDEQKPEPVLLYDLEDKKTYVDTMNRHVSSDIWRKDYHRPMVRKPPDRAQDTKHDDANYVTRHSLFVPTNIGSDKKLLENKIHILKSRQDQRDAVSVMSLSEKHKLENKITELQEALVCEKEKSMTLEHELNETYKKIRMLNKGSETLDKILSMGRIEKTTTGLSYQGSSSSSQTVFVQGLSAEQKDVLEVSKDRDVELPNIMHTFYCERSVHEHHHHVCHKWVTGFTSDIHENHGEALVDMFFYVKWKDIAISAQHFFTYELPIEPRVEDNGVLTVLGVCLPHIKQTYFSFSTDYGDGIDLEFRKSWHQYKGMLHDEKAPLIFVTQYRVSNSTNLGNFSSTYGICSIVCSGKQYAGPLPKPSKVCKFFDGWRLVFHCLIIQDGVLVDWLAVEPVLIREFLCDVSFGLEKYEYLCKLLDFKPYMSLPYVFTTASREFVRATGLQWGTYQGRLRFICIITMGSYDDVTNSPLAEVSKFVRPKWLMGISSLSLLLLRRLPYCCVRNFLSAISLVVMTLWDVGDHSVLRIFLSTSLFRLCERISRRLQNPLQLFLMDLESSVLLPLTILCELQWHILLWSEKLDEEDTQVGGRINLLWNCTSDFMYDFTCGDKQDTGRNVLSCVLFLILGFERVVVTPNSTYEKLLSFWNQEILLKSLHSVFLVDLDSSLCPPPLITCFSTAAWLMADEISVWLCTRHIYILEWFFRWVRPPSYLRELVLMVLVDLSGAMLTTGALSKKFILMECLQSGNRMHFVVLFPRKKTVMCFVIQIDKVLAAKMLEQLEFWVSVHDFHSTRRTRFLHDTSYVNWLQQDERTCNQAPLTLYLKIKGKYEIGSGSEERDKNASNLVLKVWEHRFPFRFEVESFKPGGT